MSVYSNFGSNNQYKLDKERKAREKFKPLKDNIFIVLGIMALSILLSFLSFIFVYWFLSIINIHYALKSLIACVIVCLSLLLITPDTDLKKRIRGTSRPFVLIATLISLIIGFNNYGAGILDDHFRVPKAHIYAIDSVTLISSGIKMNTVELDTLKLKGDTLSTKKTFIAGSSVIIKISNQEVRLVGFYILKPGMYKKIIDKDGKLTFKGVTNKTSLISVMY